MPKYTAFMTATVSWRVGSMFFTEYADTTIETDNPCLDFKHFKKKVVEATYQTQIFGKSTEHKAEINRTIKIQSESLAVCKN